MSKLKTPMLLIVFSFMLCFISIGYAAVSDTLRISGDATYTFEAPNTVYITNITSADTSSGSSIVSYESYLPTTVKSTVTLGNSTSSSAKLVIHLKNNTDAIYMYNGATYLDEAYSNSNITFTAKKSDGTELKVGDTIAPGATGSITVEFKYKSSVPSNRTLESIINYQFIMYVESDEDAAQGIVERMDEILNTGPDFDTLIEQMEKYQTNDRYDDSYIGNVLGSSEEDQIYLHNAFGDNLNIILNGTQTDVNIMIKREDLDGDGIDEMTIYATTDPLTSRGNIFNPYRAVVYAQVFTKETVTNVDGSTMTVWNKVGEMLTGKAKVVAYDGNIFGTGSFDTDDWTSTDRATNGYDISEVIASLK